MAKTSSEQNNDAETHLQNMVDEYLQKGEFTVKSDNKTAFLGIAILCVLSGSVLYFVPERFLPPGIVTAESRLIAIIGTILFILFMSFAFIKIIKIKGEQIKIGRKTYELKTLRKVMKGDDDTYITVEKNGKTKEYSLGINHDKEVVRALVRFVELYNSNSLKEFKKRPEL